MAQAASAITTSVIKGLVEDLTALEAGKSISVKTVGTFKKSKEGNTESGALTITFTPPKKSPEGDAQ